MMYCSVDRRKQPQQPAVVDMAWGSSARDALLALLQPATLVIINAQTGAIARTLALAQGQVVSSLVMDEWDPSMFAATTMSNSLLTCRIEDPLPAPGQQAVTPFANAQVATNLHNLPIQGQSRASSAAVSGLLLQFAPCTAACYRPPRLQALQPSSPDRAWPATPSRLLACLLAQSRTRLHATKHPHPPCHETKHRLRSCSNPDAVQAMACSKCGGCPTGASCC